MVLSLTSLVEFFSSFCLGILTYRFWEVFNERKSLIPRFLFYFVATLSLYFFFDGFLILFFAENSLALKFSVISGVFSQSLACAFLAYLVLHVAEPKINSLYGFLFIFILGLVATIFAFKIPFSPSLESLGRIKTVNWNLPPLIGFLQSSIFSITFIPLIFIFLFYSQISKIRYIKIRSVGMASVFLLGLNTAFLYFLTQNSLKFSPLTGDISLGFFNLFLFLLLLYFSFQARNYKEKHLF